MSPRCIRSIAPLLALVAPGCLDATTGSVGTASPPAVADAPAVVAPVVTPPADPPPADPPPVDPPPPALLEGELQILAVSQDGERVLFGTRPANGAPYDLWSLNVDTGAVRFVDDRVAIALNSATTFSVSADARTVAYGRHPAAWDEPGHPDAWRKTIFMHLRVWREGDAAPSDYGMVPGQTLTMDDGGARVAFRPDFPAPLTVVTTADSQAATIAVEDIRSDDATGHVAYETPDGDVGVLDLTSGSATVLGQGELVAMDDEVIAYESDAGLTAYHRASGLSFVAVGYHPTSPANAYRGIDLDIDAGQAVAVFRSGAYGSLVLWDLDTGLTQALPIPEPRAAGGIQAASRARLHAGGGVTFFPQAGWLDVDLWDYRDGVAERVLGNVCRDAALDLDGDGSMRVLLANDGCATTHPRRMYLYDEPSKTLSDTGRDARFIRAVLTGRRLVYDRPVGKDRELVLWDVGADTETPLIDNSDFFSTARRGGMWYLASSKGNAEHVARWVVVHPDGLTDVALDGRLTSFAATDRLVAYVTAVGDGDDDGASETLHVVTLDALAAGERGVPMVTAAAATSH